MTQTTEVQQIRAQLEQLSFNDRYTFVGYHLEGFPLEIVRETISYYYDRRRRNEEHKYMRHTFDDSNKDITGKAIAIRLAEKAGLLDDMVQMCVESGYLRKTMEYPNIIQSRADKERIFEELESE